MTSSADPTLLPASSPGFEPDAVVVLASDPWTRVERIDRPDRSLLRKSYSFGGLLSLRTLWRRSRAEREYRNLQALDEAGVPCVHALRWTESRTHGCVRRCEVLTEFVDGAADLRTALRVGATPARRRLLACNLGALLRELHLAGFASSTASLRNVLVLPDGQLVFCDQPYASRLRGPVADWGRALDLYDTFFSAARCADWTRCERWRGLLAYAGGDSATARDIWRRLRHRSRLWSRLARQLSRLPVFRISSVSRRTPSSS